MKERMKENFQALKNGIERKKIREWGIYQRMRNLPTSQSIPGLNQWMRKTNGRVHFWPIILWTSRLEAQHMGRTLPSVLGSPGLYAQQRPGNQNSVGMLSWAVVITNLDPYNYPISLRTKWNALFKLSELSIRSRWTQDWGVKLKLNIPLM